MSTARGVAYLFDIQVKTFDPVYDGEDVIAQARTGTGKTFSFAIPLIEKLQNEAGVAVRGRAPKVHTHSTRAHARHTWFSYEMTSEWVCVFVCRYWSWLQPESWPSRYPGTLKTLSRVSVLPVSMVAVLTTHRVSPKTSSQLKGFSNQINKHTQRFLYPSHCPLYIVLYPYVFFTVSFTDSILEMLTSILTMVAASPPFCLVDAIRSGIDILVGTPGRIKDHIQNNKLDLTKLKHVVLDEVDQMLDMGFAEQVEEILASSYKKGTITAWTQCNIYGISACVLLSVWEYVWFLQRSCAFVLHALKFDN